MYAHSQSQADLYCIFFITTESDLAGTPGVEYSVIPLLAYAICVFELNSTEVIRLAETL
jgi:hypothetical protein